MERMPHIKLTAEQAAAYALLPGDPGRIDVIAGHLEQVTPLAWNREYRSIRGIFHGIPVLAVSTGIGGPSAAIAIEELNRIGVKHLIRIGSCGALSEKLKLGDLVIADTAAAADGTSQAYASGRDLVTGDAGMLWACRESAKELGFAHFTGMCRSHDCLYLENKQEQERLWSAKGALGSDMETAALFAVSHHRNIRAASILNVVVEYRQDLAANINRYADGEALTTAGEQHQILTALHAFERIEFQKEEEN